MGERFRTHHPDIMLLDLQMPAIQGIDAIGAIRRESLEARIIVLTTYSGDATPVAIALKRGIIGAQRKGAPISQ